MNVIHTWKRQNPVIGARTARKTLYEISCPWNSPIADQNEYSLNQDSRSLGYATPKSWFAPIDLKFTDSFKTIGVFWSMIESSRQNSAV